MQKSMRKLLSLLLTLAMLLSMPLTAMAEEVVVSEEPLPIVEEVAASEATESAELPSVEVPVTEEVVIKEVLVKEVPAVEETPVVEAIVSAPVAVLAAVEEEAELMAESVAMIGEQGYETLNAAIAAALPLLATSAVTIDLVADATLSEAVEINHGANKLTIQIADSVAGSVTVTASSEAQLCVAESSVVEIKGKSAAANLVFDGTGATFATVTPFLFKGSANVTLDYVTVQNYTDSNAKAAPMVMDTSTVTITNSKFVGNTGSTAGAIRCEDSTSKLYVSDCAFTNNKSASNAGAIFVYGANVDADIIRTTFSGNTTGNGAGAIYAYYDCGLYIEGCTFTGNGGAFGNAIRIREGVVTMKSCTFTDNRGQGRGTVYCGNGGKENAYTIGEAVLEDCVFSGNSATATSGGGDIMLWRKCSVTIKGNLTMEATGESSAQFTNIYMSFTNGSIIFEGATAEVDTIHVPSIEKYSDVAVTVADVAEYGATTLTLNTPAEALRFAADGYGINANYDYCATVNDEDASVADGKFETAVGTDPLLIEVWATKKATSYVAQVGTGASAESYTTLEAAVAAAAERGEVTDVYIIDDITYTQPTTVTLNGKTRLMALGDITVAGPLTIQGNGSSASVRMITADGGKLTLNGVTMKDYTSDNSTDKWGVIAAFNGGALVLNDCTVSGITGKRVVYSNGAGTSVTATGTTFSKNYSNETGGAVSIYAKGAAYLTNCTFSENESKTYGGAIGLINSGGTLECTNCTFAENKANTAGGAIGSAVTDNYVRTIKIVGGSFTGNQAAENSGAIDASGAGTLSITGGTIFTGNKAGAYGGAFRAQDSVAVTMSNVTITGNHSANVTGSAISLRGKTLIENCTIANNTCDNMANPAWGAIHLYDTTELTLSGNNNIEQLYTGNCSIKLGAAITGSVEIHNKDFNQYVSESGKALFTAESDGIIAASLATISLTNDAYSLLDTGYLKVKGVASVDGVYYPTVTEAIETAKDNGGGTVVVADLGVDITEEIKVRPSVTLDLNGQTVICEYARLYNGAHIIDSTNGEGKLVCAKDNFSVGNAANAAMPIWVDEPDTEVEGVPVPGVDGYVFCTVDIETNIKTSAENGTFTYVFRPIFSEKVAEMLGADGATAHGLTIEARVPYSDGEAMMTKEVVQPFDEFAKEVYGNNKAFAAYVTNYASFVNSELKIYVNIESDTGVVLSSTAVQITE